MQERQRVYRLIQSAREAAQQDEVVLLRMVKASDRSVSPSR